MRLCTHRDKAKDILFTVDKWINKYRVKLSEVLALKQHFMYKKLPNFQTTPFAIVHVLHSGITPDSVLHIIKEKVFKMIHKLFLKFPFRTLTYFSSKSLLIWCRNKSLTALSRIVLQLFWITCLILLAAALFMNALSISNQNIMILPVIALQSDNKYRRNMSLIVLE